MFLLAAKLIKQISLFFQTNLLEGRTCHRNFVHLPRKSQTKSQNLGENIKKSKSWKNYTKSWKNP